MFRHIFVSIFILISAFSVRAQDLSDEAFSQKYYDLRLSSTEACLEEMTESLKGPAGDQVTQSQCMNRRMLFDISQDEEIYRGSVARLADDMSDFTVSFSIMCERGVSRALFFVQPGQPISEDSVNFEASVDGETAFEGHLIPLKHSGSDVFIVAGSESEAFLQALSAATTGHLSISIRAPEIVTTAFLIENLGEASGDLLSMCRTLK